MTILSQVFYNYADKLYMKANLSNIFKLAVILMSFFSLMSCANKKNVYQVDSRLAPYYDLFLQVGKINGSDYSTDNLILEIIDIDKVKNPDTVGYCTVHTDQRLVNPVQSEYMVVPKVSIDKKFFMTASHQAKINLIFHELGHCVLNRSHDETYGQYGYPKSLMYPLIMYDDYSTDIFIELLSVYYYQELFQPLTPQIDPQTLQLTTQNKVVNHKSNTNIIYTMTKNGCGEILNQKGESNDSN